MPLDNVQCMSKKLQRKHHEGSEWGRQIRLLPMAADSVQCRGNRPKAKLASAGNMENKMGESECLVHVLGEAPQKPCRKGVIGGHDVPSLTSFIQIDRIGCTEGRQWFWSLKYRVTKLNYCCWGKKKAG